MDDLISRQAVLDGLASIAKGKAKSDAQKSLMGRVMFFTEQLPSAQPERGCDECVFKPFKQFQPEQRWIPVSETVDVPEHEVLACDKYGTELIGVICEKDEQWMCESDECIMYDVVAWMPLPECYMGG